VSSAAQSRLALLQFLLQLGNTPVRRPQLRFQLSVCLRCLLQLLGVIAGFTVPASNHHTSRARSNQALDPILPTSRVVYRSMLPVSETF
jgi:hypothetical protein